MEVCFSGSPTKVVAVPPSKEEELEIAIDEASTSPTKRPVLHRLENELRMSAEVDGKIFVPNGSRDRYGQPRRNVGCRPKKNAGPAEELLGSAKNNGKIPGNRARTEFSAREKIQMVETIKHLYKQARLANPSKKQAEARTS